MFGQTYRPRTLAEVIGHDKVVEEIKQRFAKGNYPKVSFFTGLTGIGKTTLAQIVAKLIQCESKTEPHTPCNQCSHCKDIDKQSFIEGTHMYNASNIDIEVMRDIEDITKTKSFVSKKTVIIIDEFQELSGNKKAMKNLLKCLEEESKDVYFILLAMDSSKVDKAILNRSVVYKLYPVDYFKIAEYLYSICKSENITLDESQSEVLFEIAKASGGSVRQACSYLERVVEGNLWTLEALESTLNILSNDSIQDICLKLIDRDPEIFQVELNEDIIQKVKWALVDLSKVLVGVKLEAWRKASIDKLVGYKVANLQNVYQIITILNNLFRFPYVNREIIDTVIIELFLGSTPPSKVEVTPSKVESPEKTNVEEKPRRRQIQG